MDDTTEKSNTAQLRQRKILLSKITRRNEQLIRKETLLVSRGNIHELNNDFGNILSHQEQAADTFYQVRGAREHFNSLNWDTTFIGEYRRMLEKYIKDTKNEEIMRDSIGGRKTRAKTTAGSSSTGPCKPAKDTSSKPKTMDNKSKAKRVQMEPDSNYDEMIEDKIDRVLGEFMDLLSTQDAIMPKFLKALYEEAITLNQTGYARQRRHEEMYADDSPLGHVDKKPKMTPVTTKYDETVDLKEDDVDDQSDGEWVI